ncbi:olfactory receptor 6P1-like [Apteryx mantelli]|uniref:Olfactory receptor n=1 Tax=Apteryx mantelli TaxID=2696672 RepID=A0ABM4G7C6_9AVES
MSNSSSLNEFLLVAFADTRELQLLHFSLFLGIYLGALLSNGLIITASPNPRGSKMSNGSSLNEFLLLAFADTRELQLLHFSLFLGIYLGALLSNGLIITAVACDHHLHTPIWLRKRSRVEQYLHQSLLHLENLEASLQEAAVRFIEYYVQFWAPQYKRDVASFLTGDSTISVHGCMAQFYFFGYFLVSECYLLAMMSYDRYLAICQPLLYASLMTWKVSLQLAAVSWLVGFFTSTVVTSFISRLRFCGLKVIDHFFCDFTPLLEVACSDTNAARLVTFTLAVFNLVLPFLSNLASYVCIIAAILRIPSSVGRQKAFSTCSSHLIVVTVFYGTLIIVYLMPRTPQLRQLNKVFSFFYTILMPLVNPLIYSLRNREVREALKKAFRKALACTQSSC